MILEGNDKKKKKMKKKRTKNENSWRSIVNPKSYLHEGRKRKSREERRPWVPP